MQQHQNQYPALYNINQEVALYDTNEELPKFFYQDMQSIKKMTTKAVYDESNNIESLTIEFNKDIKLNENDKTTIIRNLKELGFKEQQGGNFFISSSDIIANMSKKPEKNQKETYEEKVKRICTAIKNIEEEKSCQIF